MPFYQVKVPDDGDPDRPTTATDALNGYANTTTIHGWPHVKKSKGTL
jgi:hypothetical protein